MFDSHYEESDEDEILSDCTLMHQTDKAWLIRKDLKKGDGYREAWFPKSKSQWDAEHRVLTYESWLLPEWDYTVYGSSPEPICIPEPDEL